MDLGLSDKVAFVAASSQGLGKAIALTLAKEGASIIICGRDASTLALAKKEIETVSSKPVLALTGDLSIASNRESIIASVLKKFKVVDILVTNTGGPKSGTFETLHQEDWDQAYQLLLGSAVGLISGLLPALKASKSGRIIAITSQAVKQPVDNLILSNAVRSSVVGLIKTLANELGCYNITVNNVMPGYTETARLQKLLQSNPEMANAVKTIPLKRFGKPDELAAAVAFLASEQASYITGVSLAVDGGWIKSML